MKERKKAFKTYLANNPSMFTGITMAGDSLPLISNIMS
jgi:hypothetical protein